MSNSGRVAPTNGCIHLHPGFCNRNVQPDKRSSGIDFMQVPDENGALLAAEKFIKQQLNVEKQVHLERLLN